MTPLNLKAYGLVAQLLWNNIPVKWAIKYNKALTTETDFTATAQRVRPSAVAAASKNFSSGPFIAAQYKMAALAVIDSFGGGTATTKVAVFETTASATADVRYTLKFKPFVAISNVNSAIHAALMDAAGIPRSGGMPAR